MLTGCIPREGSPSVSSPRSASASSLSSRKSSSSRSTSSLRHSDRPFKASTHRYDFNTRPEANAASIVTSKNAQYRITVLADGLLRLEWSKNGTFEDRASTFAVDRSFPVPDFHYSDLGDQCLEISTKRFRLSYDKKPFSASGLSVQVLGSMTDYDSIWRYGNPVKDLGGTVRTLDEIDGRTALGPSVISRNGYGLIDDSQSMLFTKEGWVASRDHQNEQVDIYLFAYGHDYRAAMQTFYQLSGHQPQLPRWALGNWWSRFYAYGAEEYLNLMDKFKQTGIPLSVAVIDMDWHIASERVFTIVVLHSRLNDHPADGIHSFEDQYNEVSQALSHDATMKDPIRFDITDHKFCDAFYDVLHRGVEQDSGCDFWWTDWQQGSHSRIPGIDPLWMLNHFGFLDNKVNTSNSQPLTFSRFAGPGSHRYPVGFSGDTIVSWASLQFQPELTNSASNIGYGWWSHDIGGHMKGKKDDELATRWVQYGVFSPIMRLHSTANPWNSKEPWNYSTEACTVQIAFLQFRHKLLPYLQAMNIRASRGEPLSQPMYWDHPNTNEAYEVPNQYMFGSSLLVAPITSPQDTVTGLACTKGWLPRGKFVDLFTGRVYTGNRLLWLHRPLKNYPVFAPTGAIIPLDASKTLQNGCPIPTALEVLVVVGKDGSFELDESEGGSSNPSKKTITFNQHRGVLTIKSASGGIPRQSHRHDWTIHFLGAAMPASSIVSVTINGRPSLSSAKIAAACESSGFKLHLSDISSDIDEIAVCIGCDPQLEVQSPLPGCREVLHRAQIDYDLKQRIWGVLIAGEDQVAIIGMLHAVDIETKLLGALMEILTAS